MTTADSKLFELMAERVRDYAIFLLDPEGRILSWNAGARRIKLYTREEILGQHFSVFYTPEDKARNWPERELKQATLEGRFEDEGWRVRKDGSRFWANVMITALRDDQGQLLAFSKITRDLTERRRQEEQLRESEERFRLLIEGVQDYAVYLLNPEGVVTSWNPGATRIQGYAAEEIIGLHFSRFFTAEDVRQGKPWTGLAVARETGRFEDEGWQLRKDGARFWARVVLTRLHDAHGELRGFASVTRDLTRERHTAALETSARQVNDFIAVLAHELRNPLAPIRTAAELLEHIKPGDEAFEKTRAIIERQSALLARMVDDLLDINRITRGALELQRRRIALGEVVTSAIEAARPGLEAAQHRLDVTVPADPVWVEGDMDRLTQALANLLNNAVRYTDRGGDIAVSLQARHTGDTGEAELRVKDNGRGIEPELLGSIFGMFVQGRGAMGRAGSGLGVGLALARSIVELHHGTLEAKSEGPGRGAEFVMRVPLANNAAPAQEVRRATPSTRLIVARRRVLVVDDNVDAAEMLTQMLRHLGHEAVAVHDGPDALRAAESLRPDLILLDLGMPGMNGLEVAQRLRRNPRMTRAQIVAITGWGKPDDRARTREAGFDLHLVKPLDEARLRELLERPIVH